MKTIPIFFVIVFSFSQIRADNALPNIVVYSDSIVNSAYYKKFLIDSSFQNNEFLKVVSEKYLTEIFKNKKYNRLKLILHDGTVLSRRKYSLDPPSIIHLGNRKFSTVETRSIEFYEKGSFASAFGKGLGFGIFAVALFGSIELAEYGISHDTDFKAGAYLSAGVASIGIIWGIISGFNSKKIYFSYRPET